MKKGQNTIGLSKQSWIGKHCETTALRRVLTDHGREFSEEMLLGLGGGIGFIYWYMKGMLCPLVGGRCKGESNFIAGICHRIGIQADVIQTTSNRKAHERLVETLERGIPAIVYADMAFLPYLVIPSESHFGGHSIVVYQIDGGTGEALVYDRSKRPFTISLDDLEAARRSKYKPFPPKNRMVVVSPEARSVDMRRSITEAISNCCQSILNPPIRNLGLPGLLKWAQLITGWPKSFKGMSLYGCLLGTFIYIRIGGSGGDAFRSMYSRFLKEAAQVLNKPALTDVASHLHKSAERWKQLSDIALPGDTAVLGRIRDLMVKKNNVFEEGRAGMEEEMRKIQNDLDSLQEQIGDDLKKAPEIVAAMQEEILGIHQIEKVAFTELQRLIG